MKVMIVFILLVICSACSDVDYNRDYKLKEFIEKGEVLLINQKEKLITLNDSTEIYKIPILIDSLYFDYFLILQVNNKICDELRINGNWLDDNENEYEPNFRFLEKTVFGAVDFNELSVFTIDDRYHNGNICNGVAKRFISFYNNKLKYLGYLEVIQHLPFSDEFILRKISEDFSYVNVYKAKRPKDNERIEFLSKININLSNDSLEFSIIREN